jgi:hypothetical protein
MQQIRKNINSFKKEFSNKSNKNNSKFEFKIKMEN